MKPSSEGDDVYRGWRIPGGSMIIPNIWGMCNDEVCRLFILDSYRLVFKGTRSRMCTKVLVLARQMYHKHIEKDPDNFNNAKV